MTKVANAELATEIVDASRRDDGFTVVRELDLGTECQNQLLFFLKPEVFLGSVEHSLAIVQLALSRFEEFGMQLGGVALVSGAHLSGARCMDRHYGYINQLSRSASGILDAGDEATLRNVLEFSEGPILGGHEFLAANPEFDAEQLDELWATKESLKLRSGFYYQKYDFPDGEVMLVNGFHPAQLNHFTAADRRIALAVVHSDLPWSVLRSRLIGDTFPERALMGSIRRELRERAKELGLGEVTIANNGVHLSAGAFEALFELVNFLGEASTGFSVDECRVARLMSDVGLSDAETRRALTNPTALVGGGEVSLFDATEECDTASSVELYRTMFAEQ